MPKKKKTEVAAPPLPSQPSTLRRLILIRDPDTTHQTLVPTEGEKAARDLLDACAFGTFACPCGHRFPPGCAVATHGWTTEYSSRCLTTGKVFMDERRKS